MARKRMIDPSFWVDEKLGTCDPLTRLTFMGLISQSDDEGRLNGHPALLKSVIFPYDDLTSGSMEGFLKTLEDKNLIQRYEVDGQKYILLPNFFKHQTINKPTESKIPPPPVKEDYGSGAVGVQPNIKEENISKEKIREVKLKENDKNSDEFSDLKEALGVPEPTRGISQEFQAEAVRIATALGVTGKRVGAYMKVLKEDPRKIVLQAYSFAVDHPTPDARDKMFFWKLNELKNYEKTFGNT